MLRIHAWFCAAVALAAAAPAHAQGERDAEARGLFDAGESAYEAGRFADAERYFRESYELSGRAELLYNIALSAEQARHDQAAIDAYRGFLEALPDSPRAPRARNRLAALTQMAGGSDGGRTDPSPGGSGGPDVGGVVLLASGGAVAIAGAVLVGLAAADVASVENAARGTTWAEVSDAYGRSEALSIAGFVLLGVGVVAASVGVVLFAVGGGDAPASANLRLGPTGLTLAGAF
ncbi:MAG: hypothetical protein KF729_06260 [Sandaracinaceae bacterium]|nr:hypothetical protein [Sandaracinaceae bacterium]